MTIKQGSAIIAGAGGGIANYDNKSITENLSAEIQTVGVINSRDNSTAIKTWTGTKVQYDAIGTKDANTLYNITDDTSSENIMQTILSSVYPVGSIYITTANTCPLSVLISGSTWELVSSGRVLQGADSGHSAGTAIEAGLPNITGNINYMCATSSQPTSGNAFRFSAQETGTNKNTTTGGGENMWNVSFDASYSNSIYGNSSTVQPPAYVVNIYRRTA